MSKLEKLQHNWDGFAEVDPLWAILTDPAKENGRWNISDFFASGKIEIKTVFEYLKSLNLDVNIIAGPALDFGCGVGRLTQAMSEYFDLCYGVDISTKMIEQAKAFNEHPEKCNYTVNTSADLSIFDSNYFGFIYTSIVLQHIPYQYSKEYLKEFVRVLKPGGVLIFQIPDRYEGAELRDTEKQSLRKKLRIRTRLKNLFRFAEFTGYGRHSSVYQLKGYESEMHSIQEDLVRAILNRAGAKIIDVKFTNSTAVGFNGNLQYLEEEIEDGYVSKQYCVTK